MNIIHTTVNAVVLSFLLMFFTDGITSCRAPEVQAQIKENNYINGTGYDLSAPDEIIDMPDILHEISGITLIDQVSVACIQDEYGTVYIFDLVKKQIRREILFFNNGDYEGITRVGKKFFILRSDGILFEISDDGSSRIEPKIYQTGIPGKDIEGLCYDNKEGRLLINHKSDMGKSSGYKNRSLVYGFDLRSGTVSEKPAYNFDLFAITQFALDNDVISPKKDKNNSGKKKNKPKEAEPDIKLRPSAICIHPVTDKLFVVSAIENKLFIFNRNGTIENIEKLDKDIFNMPEGITFFQNGDMLISNEGQNKRATILKFNYNK
ncbi:MAG: hypothetical protein JXL81_14635 [Deltaproteobacteria bacterium]|nr:hypothetical protein [Deltaproteobacteria bacterium]